MPYITLHTDSPSLITLLQDEAWTLAAAQNKLKAQQIQVIAARQAFAAVETTLAMHQAQLATTKTAFDKTADLIKHLTEIINFQEVAIAQYQALAHVTNADTENLENDPAEPLDQEKLGLANRIKKIWQPTTPTTPLPVQNATVINPELDSLTRERDQLSAEAATIQKELTHAKTKLARLRASLNNQSRLLDRYNSTITRESSDTNGAQAHLADNPPAQIERSQQLYQLATSTNVDDATYERNLADLTNQRTLITIKRALTHLTSTVPDHIEQSKNVQSLLADIKHKELAYQQCRAELAEKNRIIENLTQNIANLSDTAKEKPPSPTVIEKIKSHSTSKALREFADTMKERVTQKRKALPEEEKPNAQHTTIATNSALGDLTSKHPPFTTAANNKNNLGFFKTQLAELNNELQGKEKLLAECKATIASIMPEYTEKSQTLQDRIIDEAELGIITHLQSIATGIKNTTQILAHCHQQYVNLIADTQSDSFDKLITLSKLAEALVAARECTAWHTHCATIAAYLEKLPNPHLLREQTEQLLAAHSTEIAAQKTAITTLLKPTNTDIAQLLLPVAETLSNETNAFITHKNALHTTIKEFDLRNKRHIYFIAAAYKKKDAAYYQALDTRNQQFKKQNKEIITMATGFLNMLSHLKKRTTESLEHPASLLEILNIDTLVKQTDGVINECNIVQNKRFVESFSTKDHIYQLIYQKQQQIHNEDQNTREWAANMLSKQHTSVATHFNQLLTQYEDHFKAKNGFFISLFKRLFSRSKQENRDLYINRLRTMLDNLQKNENGHANRIALKKIAEQGLQQFSYRPGFFNRRTKLSETACLHDMLAALATRLQVIDDLQIDDSYKANDYGILRQRQHATIG